MAMATSEVREGPVLSVITRRIRGLRKKYNRIIQMEELIAQGKTLNKEQEEVLRSKPAVSSLISELEKLREPLSAAVQEESILEDDALFEDLLNLIYLGSCSMCVTKTLDRLGCFTCGNLMDKTGDPLREEDVDLINHLKAFLIWRPADSNLPRKIALQNCVDHAKAWIAKSNKSIEPNDVTLRERLHIIMAKHFFFPEINMGAASPHVPAPLLIQGKRSVVQGDESQEREIGGDQPRSARKDLETRLSIVFFVILPMIMILIVYIFEIRRE